MISQMDELRRGFSNLGLVFLQRPLLLGVRDKEYHESDEERMEEWKGGKEGKGKGKGLTVT